MGTTQPPPATAFEPGTVLDAKFRIERCIGHGGMGAVYEIHHELTKHRRALKMLHPHVSQDVEAVNRFLQEASAAGTIENPHITETYDAGWLNNGQPYVVMELLEGEPLDERMFEESVLPIKDTLAIISQAAHAVHDAHEAGIVHRDLKPENIFLTVTEELRTFVKILDFGVSKFDNLATTRQTRDGAFVGTPAYMSPEQFLDGKHVDGRTDVYALGVILFECLTGEHPYPCETFAELARKIMVEEAPPPSAVFSQVPREIDTITKRALAKDPDDRYPTAKAFAQALDAVRTGAGVTLPQGSSWRSELPPPAELLRDVSVDVSDLDRPDVDLSGETQRSATALHLVTPGDPPKRSPIGWLVAVLAAAVVIGVLFTLQSEDTGATPTPKTSTAPIAVTPVATTTATTTAAAAPSPTAEPPSTAVPPSIAEPRSSAEPVAQLDR